MIALEFRNFESSWDYLKFVKITLKFVQITQLFRFFHLDLEQLAAIFKNSSSTLFTAKNSREGSTDCIFLSCHVRASE